ncbi:MAG: hypothetical protein IKS37_07155 [Solobacterium sp.]|nr:hypothetical protein [Solobacterium sp.]
MKKKKARVNQKPEIEKEADFYHLKKKAVQELVEANEENSPVVSEEELRKYYSRSKIHIPGWAKMLFIKWWFSGAVCFFFIWGLGMYFADILDTLLVTSIAMGIVTDLLTNNALRFFEKQKGENERWIMVNVRGYSSFILNILYACLVMFFVYSFYSMINAGAAMVSGQTDRIVLGVEPILFGLAYLGFDLLFIEIKHYLQRVIKKAKAGAR